jgi:hypothetical protein
MRTRTATAGTAQIASPLALQATRRSALLLRIFENPAPATNKINMLDSFSLLTIWLRCARVSAM